ncbi:MAG: LysR family transcriptional regulator [Halieaceae bacterium]|jgi:LysR family transcriptional activator of dmlA|nr:LysR family transcriptional regulator [Halieaceae bacterium]
MAVKNQNMQGLILFSHINRQGSLSAAAQLLGISRSSVSKQLVALEEQIGSRLFNRTTRRIALTEVGKQVLLEAHKVELALQSIEHISEDSQSVVAGNLNVTCASAQGRIQLVPLITRFLAKYPQVNVNLQLEDRFVDMVAENVDVSIRVGYLPDSSLVARKIGELAGVLCASPEYLSTAPPLETPSDLLHHRCLFYQNSQLAMKAWSFVGNEGEETVTVSGPLSINDPGALISAALAHVGVLLIDKGLLGDTLRDGKLVPVLPGYCSIGSLPIYVVYPEREFVPAKTRALVDFLLHEMPDVVQAT